MYSASASFAAALLVASSATTVLTVHDPRIDEASGLAQSVRRPGLLWMHNDGGTSAHIYGVNRTGRTVARLTLRGIDPYDPEALAMGKDGAGRPALFLGDIGDNSERRPNVSVFRVSEPTSLGARTVRPTWYRFRYADGPHDAEALLVDPRDSRIWVATKGLLGGGLYRAPRRLKPESQGTNVLRRVADVPPLVTDGTFLPDGRFVLRSYTSVYLYAAPGERSAEALLPAQPQGESVAYDGKRLLLGSEGVRSQVLAVPVPTAGDPSPSASSAPSSRAHRSPAMFEGEGVKLLGMALGGAVLLSLLIGVAARFRKDR